jgi:hypothetical protein
LGGYRSWRFSSASFEQFLFQKQRGEGEALQLEEYDQVQGSKAALTGISILNWFT